MEDTPGFSSTGNNRSALQTAHIPIYCAFVLFYLTLSKH